MSGASTIHNYQTLPTHDNINQYSYCIEVRDQMFVQKGKMIAYYGNLKFESLGSASVDNMVRHMFNAAQHMGSFMVAMGQGKLILGDRGFNINSYDLENGSLTIKMSNLMGFDRTLACQQSVLPGFLCLRGSGKVLASSNGQVHFLEPPCRVDADALLGWDETPTPAYHYDYEYVQGIVAALGAMTGFSGGSGEEKQVDFFGSGNILVQSSETAMMEGTLVEQLTNQATSLNQNQIGDLVTRLSTMLQR